MSEIALPAFASVEIVSIMSEPPEAFTLMMRLTERPLPFAFEGVIVRVVFPRVVGVPVSTHVLLSERPGGSPVWPHEVGAPEPESMTAWIDLRNPFLRFQYM